MTTCQRILVCLQVSSSTALRGADMHLHAIRENSEVGILQKISHALDGKVFLAQIWGQLGSRVQQRVLVCLGDGWETLPRPEGSCGRAWKGLASKVHFKRWPTLETHEPNSESQVSVAAAAISFELREDLEGKLTSQKQARCGKSVVCE